MTSRSTRPWWRDAVIYQIYPRSFADSNGDGVGDLAGIRAHLGHVAELGVDAIWISPFYPSPQADGGYDVSDYRDIDPLFGTLADADLLIAEAHRLGLRLIVDLVPNHTSDQHAWFQSALAAAPGSRERERYLFRDGRGPDGNEPPNDWLSVFGGSAWERVADGQWFLHLFAPEQPDLNWRNPEVRAEFVSILHFWLARGADGFRVDVANSLFKDPALPDLGEAEVHVLEPTKRIDHPYWDRDEVLDVYEEWHQVLAGYDGERMLVAEAWVANPQRLARYVAPGRFHSAFNFDFLRCPWRADLLREVIDSCLEADAAVGAPATWVLSNHDVVRHVTRYGRPQPTAGQVSTHIEADAPPPDLQLGRRRARAAALLMLALPGGAYVYQGEELGLEEIEDLPESLLQDPAWKRSGHTQRGRDGCRVPIPWGADAPPFEFGPAGSTPWLPQPQHWASSTVAAEEFDDTSMLALYRSALRLRRAHPALGDGPMRWLDAPGEVVAFARDPGFACFVNVGADAVPLPESARVVLSSVPLDDARTLPGDTAVWLDVRP